MNPSETRLIEEGWEALVERLGQTEATRFVMLLDRRTGGAIQHIRYMQSISPTSPQHRRNANPKKMSRLVSRNPDEQNNNYEHY